jgi:hypothetical protein
MNALFYLCFYQLCYMMQLGLAEWDSETTYYKGSLAQDGSGNIYVSITDGNIGNALSSTANWLPQTPLNFIQTVVFGASPFTLNAANSGNIIEVDASLGIFRFNLPDPTVVKSGFNFTVVDKLGLFSPTGNYAYLVPHGAELILGLNSNYLMQAAWGTWTIYTDGTNWFIK